jgi:hypothetical protein
MADALVLEFDEDRALYERVNGLLGIDPASGEGDWPPGLLFHSGAAKPGGFLVFEIWESKADQERFMEERLGRALQEGGVSGPPSRLEWLDLAAYHNLAG